MSKRGRNINVRRVADERLRKATEISKQLGDKYRTPPKPRTEDPERIARLRAEWEAREASMTGPGRTCQICGKPIRRRGWFCAKHT